MRQERTVAVLIILFVVLLAFAYAISLLLRAPIVALLAVRLLYDIS